MQSSHVLDTKGSPKSDLKMSRKVILKCSKNVFSIPATLHKLSCDTFCDVLTRHCDKKKTHTFQHPRRKLQVGVRQKVTSWKSSCHPQIIYFDNICHELCHICKFWGTHFVPDLDILCNQTTLNWLKPRNFLACGGPQVPTPSPDFL